MMKIYVILFTLLFCTPGAQAAGHVVGNGGDEYAQTFTRIGADVWQWLRDHGRAENIPLPCELLLGGTPAVHVESTHQALFLHGAPKDALNFPALRKIMINRAAWDRITSLSARRALVLHEYLGLFGVDDHDYRYSNLIYKSRVGTHIYTRCADLPGSQQAVFQAFNAYLKSGDRLEAMMYIGALKQYLADVEQFGDPTDPDYGNTYTVALFESTPSYLCTDVTQFERQILGGDPTALELLLFYAAVSHGDDGAAAEVLGEIQLKVKKLFPQALARIELSNAAFFQKHPIAWMSDYL